MYPVYSSDKLTTQPIETHITPQLVNKINIAAAVALR